MGIEEMVKIYEINEYTYMFWGITSILFLIGWILLSGVFVIQYIECRKKIQLFKSVGMILISCFFLWLFYGGCFDEYKEIRDYKKQFTMENGRIITGEMKGFEREVGRQVRYNFTVDDVEFELYCSPLIQIKEYFQPDKTLHKNGQVLKIYYIEEVDESENLIIKIESYEE